MATHEVLTPSQRKQFNDALEELSTRDIARYYTLSAEDMRIIRQQRGAANRLGFALQLCYLRFPGWPLREDDNVPNEILLYVAQQLKIRAKHMKDYGRTRGQTLDDHLAVIQTQLGYRRFDAVLGQELSEWLLPQAIESDNSFVLIAALMEEMRGRRIILPALSTLEELVWYVQQEADQRLYSSLIGSLTEMQRDALRQMLTLRTESPKISHLAWLQEPPGSTKPINFNRLAERLDYVRKINLDPELIKAIPYHRLLQFSRQAERFTPKRLDNLDDAAETLALLAAFVLHRMTLLTDQCLQMHDQLVGQMLNKSDNRQTKQFHRSRKAINRIIRLYNDIGQQVIQARTDEQDAYAAIEKVLTWVDYIQSVQEAQQLARPADFTSLDLVDKSYSGMRRYSPRLLDMFEFSGSEFTQSIRAGIEVIRSRNEQEPHPPLDDDAPIGFVKPSWISYVKNEDESINHRYYELCLLNEMRNSLRSGDLWVKGSRQFKDFEEYLIPKPQWEAMRSSGNIPLPIEVDFQHYISERATKLHQEMATVTRLMERNQLPGVSLKKGRLSFERIKGEEAPAGTTELSELIDKVLPRIRLPELLAEVDDWTRFSRRFTHVRTGEPVEDTTELLAVIAAEGINLSLAKMADASAKLTEGRLTWIDEWFIRDETYQQALIELVNFHHRQPFAGYWGDGSTSSSDGQFYLVAGKRSALAQVNKHYGFQPGVMLYGHQSDQYGSFNINVINPNEHQAPHLVDGLLYHRTELEIQEHYADTGGYTDHIFAMCHLLGYRFSPRIRDLNEKRLYYIDDASLYPALDPWISDEKINIKRIEQHWDEVLRLMTSIQTGTVTASLMMKRLAAYTRQNSLAGALQELGRIEKSLFMLAWLQDPEYRRRVMIGLNKGEKKNALARVVFAHRSGHIYDNSYEEQLNRASGLNLVIMAIVVWNTVYMAHAIDTLRQQGHDISDEQIKHLSPLRWEHINFTGDYVWEKLLPTTENNRRPLRIEVVTAWNRIA